MTRPTPATTDEVLAALTDTFPRSGWVSPLSAGAVAEAVARARGFNGYSSRNGYDARDRTNAQLVGEWVSQASVAKALDAAVTAGDAHAVTSEDAPYARNHHVRKGSTYYVSTEAHERAVTGYEQAQTAHLRRGAEEAATEALIEKHRAEWDTLVKSALRRATREAEPEPLPEVDDEGTIDPKGGQS